MRNKGLKIIFMFIVLGFCIWIFSNSTSASYISVKASTTSASPGQTINVTISSDCIGKVNLSSSNCVIEKNAVFVDGVENISVKLGNSGTAIISATPIDMSDSKGNPVNNISGSSTSISIKSLSNNKQTDNDNSTTTSQSNKSTIQTTQTPNKSENKKSNNANLSNLGIRPNDFSGFKAGTTTYNVTVPENIETIEVYAKAQDPKSKISGTGKRKLQKGKNTASVTVTAEDGTKKTYTINITRKEQEEEKEDGEAQGQKDEESTDEKIKEENGLAKLEIQDVSLSPSFQSNIYEYTVKYIGEETKLNIDAQSTNKEYTVEITGNEELKEGENIITILVSDAQSNNVATYQITVNKSLVDEETIKQEQEDKEKDENKKKIIIYGGIAIGIFIVVIIIFIIWRKRNRKLEEEYGVPFYNENHNNQLEDFDENMKYKGNFRANNNEQRENKKIMKEKYLDIYNRRDIELDRSEEEGNRKNKNRGKRFR